MAESYQPLILIGAARSGTKFLRDLIARHPDVSKVPYDINYVWRLGNERVPHDELSPAWLTSEIRDRIRRRFEASRDGAPFLIEKTVSNCLRVPYVQAVFPEALFIHLVRDGVDVVESAYRQWMASPEWGYILKKTLSFPLREAPGYGLSYATTTLYNLVAPNQGRLGTWGPRYQGIDEDVATLDLLAVCGIQWMRSVQKALDDLSGMPIGRVLMVRYEEVVREPRKHLELVADFCSIDPGFFRDLNLDSVSTENIGTGYRSLSTDQVGLVLEYIQDGLARLGYDKSSAVGVPDLS